MKEIHVLYIITKLELGGAQKVCLSLVKGLRDQGVHPFLISGKEGKLVPIVQEQEGVLLLDGFKREISLRYFFSEIKNFIKLIHCIKKLRHNNPALIVHTHSTKAGLLGRWAAWFAGIKTRIHTIHGYAFHSHQSIFIWFVIYLLELITSLITTHFVCVSSEDVKTGIRLFPYFETKYSIIRAAIDQEELVIPARSLPAFPLQQPFTFGTVACFKKQKNLFDLFKAFELCHHYNPHVKLEVIGDGSLRPVLEEWIREHQLHDKIILRGWQETIAPFMSTWHAFVLSSLWEGLPCAIVEARFFKLPVLCYNTGGIHDVITHGENGYLYKQGHWQELGTGMLNLTRNKIVYEKLQRYPDNLHDFDSKYMINQHLMLYKSLIS